MIVPVVLLMVGLAVLVAGGEALVRGGGRLGRALGLSPLVVGLTIVAFATSAPELAVSVDATLSGSAGLAVGNVVGSNITNILLVLGVAALLLPVAVRSQMLRRDVPVMVGLSILLLALSMSGTISRFEGAALVTLLVVYLAWSVTVARRSNGEAVGPSAATDPPRVRPVDLALVAVGIGLLVLGARLLVTGAVEIAAAVGLSDLVIGLTVISIGTSLPEVATSVIAALRGERELAVGNVVGSNIFNVGAVMGVTAIVSPTGVPVADAAIRFDVPVMVAAAIVLLPVIYTRSTIERWEAALFLAYYVVYVAYLLLEAGDHDSLPAFSAALLWFVLPLTALALAVLVMHEVRRRRRAERD